MIYRKETIIIDDIIKYLNENRSIAIILGAILASIVGTIIKITAEPISRFARQTCNTIISHTRNQWKNLKTNLHKKASMNREETLQILKEVIEITGRQEDLNTELLRILNKILKEETERYDYHTSSQYEISNDYHHHQLTEIIKANVKVYNKQEEIEKKIEELNRRIQ